MSEKLTQEIVKELLDYNAETGLLTWRERNVKWFKAGRRKAEEHMKTWNTKNANRPALNYTNPNGYKTGYVLGCRHLAHRIIWLWMTGELPESAIDHINHKRDDNRWDNLRVASHTTNMRNRGKTNKSKEIFGLKTNIDGTFSIHFVVGSYDTDKEADNERKKVEKFLLENYGKLFLF